MLVYSANDSMGVAHPPVVPRRPHPPKPRHETSSGTGGVNLSPAAKAKKPPMPPPRLKTNADPHHEVTPRSPRLSPSHHIITGGGGGKTAAKLMRHGDEDTNFDSFRSRVPRLLAGRLSEAAEETWV